MASRVKGNFHARFRTGENLEITSKGYLSLWDEYIDIIKFHDIEKCKSVKEAHEFANKYRIIRIVEMSDLIASRNIRG